MKECGVYHCERLGDGTVCFLAAQLLSQANNPVVGEQTLTKRELLTLAKSIKEMADKNGCSCGDQIDSAISFAQGVAETLREKTGA